MEWQPDFKGWTASAVALLEYALADDNVDRATEALSAIGRAEALSGQDRVPASSSDASELRETLRRLAASDPDLLGRAAANAVYPWRDYGGQGLPDALFARSGYQVLLDMGTWPEPPLSAYHLLNVDTELREALSEQPLPSDEVPTGFPETHTWWH